MASSRYRFLLYIVVNFFFLEGATKKKDSRRYPCRASQQVYKNIKF